MTAPKKETTPKKPTTKKTTTPKAALPTLEDLQRGNLIVTDKSGRKYRLEPSFKVGDYRLVFIPKE